VAAGKINLDAPLGTYLPDYRTSCATAVTIGELLTTGGTAILRPQFDAHRLELQSLQDYEKRTVRADRPLRQRANGLQQLRFRSTRAAIERVSGQSYYDYVREHVYAPAA